MGNLIEQPIGPQEGDEVTVILILPDGTRMETIGTFSSADWHTDWHDGPDGPGPYPTFVKGESTFDLHLRAVSTKRITAAINNGVLEIEGG